MITQELLKEFLNYDPDTGVFTWKIARKGSPGKGRRAGGLDYEGYTRIKIDYKNYRASRLAWLYMNGREPEGQIDHIDGDRSNDSISNLRDVDQTTNGQNQRKNSSNTSGITGVCWHKKQGKWMAYIGGVNRVYLGYFSEKSDAIAARKNAHVELGYHKNHGKLAKG